MKATHINAFIEATRGIMEVMGGTRQFERKELSADRNLMTYHDISAVIGISGDCQGSVVLSFSSDMAFRVLSEVVGEKVCNLDEDACDVVGEMVNIIAGNAIQELMASGLGHMERTVPNIISGKGHKVYQPKNMPCINIFFSTDKGDFAMQVSLMSCETD